MYAFILAVSSALFLLLFLPGIRIGYSIPYLYKQKGKKKVACNARNFFLPLVGL